MGVTEKDIAERAGVSVTTVSLVLNNAPSRISEATKRKVLDAARELNFRKIKRSSGKVPGTIGIIVPDICNIFFASICAACERTARKNGYSVLFGSSEDDVELDLEYIDVFYNKGVNGAILVKAAHTTPGDEEKLRNKIEMTDIPFVTVDRKLDNQRIRSVTVDHYKGAFLAVEHLLNLGHKRIGCIAGPGRDVVTYERLRGYRDAHMAYGLVPDESIVCFGNYRIESGLEHLPYLLGKSVSAIFCFNDMMAFGVYRGCSNYNLKIPEDLSVVGFDDIPFCETHEIPLTTVNQPADKIGDAATRQLINLLHRREQAEDVLFEPVLKVRASTAPYNETRKEK